jgi:hypothetical protein
MVGMLALGGMILAALMVAVAFGFVLFLVKAVLLLVLLPFRLLAGLLLLPFRLMGGLLGLLMVPIAGVVGLVALLAVVLGGLFMLTVPLLPLAVIALVVWMLRKARTVPAAA